MNANAPVPPNSALAGRRPAAPDAGATRCARCGAAMECGALAGAEHCWCMELPPLPAASRASGSDAGCLCRACLTQALATSESA